MPCSIAMLAAALVGASFATEDTPATHQPYMQEHNEDRQPYADEYMHAGRSYQQTYKPDAQNASAWSFWEGSYQQQYEEKYMHQYVQAYGGQNSAWTPNVRNTSDWRSWREAYMKFYADAYVHFAHHAENLPEGPEQASKCQTVQDLEKWRARKTAEIDAFTPAEYQNISKDDLETTFAQRKAQIEADSTKINASVSIVQEAAWLSSPALLVASLDNNKSAASHVQREMADADSMQSLSKNYAAQWFPHVQNVSNPKDWRDAFMKAYAHAYMHLVTDEESIARRFPDAPAHARDCKTLEDLQQWRAASKARLQAFVPNDYQDSAFEHVDQEFAEREADLKQEQLEKTSAGVPPVTGPAATHLSSLTLAHASVGVPPMMACMVGAAMTLALRSWTRKSDSTDVYLLHSEEPVVVV